MDRNSAGSGPGLRRMLPFAVIIVAAIVGYFTLGEYLTFERLGENREALIGYRDENYALTSAVFIAAYVVVVAFSLPGAAIASLTGGFLFGLFPGALYNVLAATAGATVIFLAARMGLGEYLSKRIDQSSGAVAKFREGIRENEISFLLLLRLVPAVPFFVANLVPALVGANFRNFVLTTFFGIMPGAIVYTWVGVGLGEVFARGESPNLGIIFEWQILGPILALCALAAMPIAIRAIRKNRGAPEE